jgi:hypothetical protein
MMTLGDVLMAQCAQATHELVLVAPFIKSRALERVISCIREDIGLTCVTRWRPEEISAGVSDLEIWPLLRDRPNTKLWLRADLHAKYYRADETCLIGSANLTSAALGWSVSSNLEILAPYPATDPMLLEFERHLMNAVVLVDDGLYETMAAVVARIPIEKVIGFADELLPQRDDGHGQASSSLEAWIPTLRVPEHLYTAYTGKVDTLTSSSSEAAMADLAVLRIPPGLSHATFESYVGIALLQMPIVVHVDVFLNRPRRFGEVSAFLRSLPCADEEGFDSKIAWQTLMRWLLVFLVDRYNSSVFSHTEMFSKNTRYSSSG